MIKQFFDKLYMPGMFMEARAISLGTRKVVGREFIRTHGELSLFCARHMDHEAYVGVAPRTRRGGTAADCMEPRCLWVDIDFKNVDEATARADLALYDLVPTMIVRSGGGLHAYWAVDGIEMNAVGPALRRLATDLHGDMTCAEPAHILRVPETLNHKYDPPRRVEIESINDNIYDAAAFASGHAASPPYDGPTAGAAALAKASAWIAEQPPAVSGEGGDNHTFATACALIRDHGLSFDDALAMMLRWNERCEPPWEESDIIKKLRGAMAYGSGEIGASDPIRDFADAPDITADLAVEDDKIDAPEGLMARLSRWFKVVDDNGALRVYRSVRDETLNRQVWRRYRRNDFLEVCQAQLMLPTVKCGEKANGDPRHVPAGQFWLDMYRKKETYSGITMMPECASERTPDGRLNIWRGFAVEEKPGSWGMLQELIYAVLCGWDQTSYDYIMRWMAKAVQMPWKPAGTALVFRGKKGAGKGTLGRAFFQLFGQHGMQVASRELLTGRFNAHLRDCVALFADEAFWAGDKAGEGVLKAFITEPALAYEGKGKDPEMGRNCLHVIMASNSDWVVPAGMDNERRFAVFDAEDDGRLRGSWNRLNAELGDGGLQAMLYDLRRIDISEFDVFAIPRTNALMEQKMHAMEPIAAWLLECAENEWSDFGEPLSGMYSAEEIYGSYLRSCDQKNARGVRSNEIMLGIALRKYIPGGVEKKRLMQNGQRKHFYMLADSDIVVRNLKKMLGAT